MESYSVAEVASMLQVNEETVRRWIREGKLEANRKLGRGGSSITLDNIVNFVNQPPYTYIQPMIAWLNDNNIRYSLQAQKTAGGKVLTALAGAFLGVPGIIASDNITSKAAAPYIVLNNINYQGEVLDNNEDVISAQSEIIDAPDLSESEVVQTVEFTEPDDTFSQSAEIMNVRNSSTETPPSQIVSNDIDSKILEEQIKLIQLQQKRTRIDAEIKICESQIEYYRLLQKKK